MPRPPETALAAGRDMRSMERFEQNVGTALDALRAELAAREEELEQREARLAECERRLQQGKEQLQVDRLALVQQAVSSAEVPCDGLLPGTEEGEGIKMEFTRGMQRLRIGGETFCTTRSTLCTYQDSMLAAMFSGRYVLEQDDDGAFFIDRDGTHFRHILNFLRDGPIWSPPEAKEAREELRREAEFYNLAELVRRLAAPDQAVQASGAAAARPLREANIGVRVMRGPDWQWENQDGGYGQLGTTIGGHGQLRWVTVEWDNGRKFGYRVGASGSFDLAEVVNPSPAPPRPAASPPLTERPGAGDVEDAADLNGAEDLNALNAAWSEL